MTMSGTSAQVYDNARYDRNKQGDTKDIDETGASRSGQ